MNHETVYSEKKNINPHQSPFVSFIAFLILIGALVYQLVITIQFSRQLSQAPVHQIAEGISRFEQINMIPDVTLVPYRSNLAPSLSIETGEVLLTGYVKQGMFDYIPGRVWNPDLSLISLDFNSGNIKQHTELDSFREEMADVFATESENLVVNLEDFAPQIISNVAVDGEMVFFLTENAELVAVNSINQEKVILQFVPELPQDGEYLNSYFLVAANEHVVAAYFGDSRQLFIFHFQ